MSETPNDPFLEPMRMWREWYQKSEKQWSEALTELMADERVGKKFGRYFQEWLHAQNMFTELVGQQLANLNLPSRVDVISVRDQLGEVEDGLATLTAAIHQLRKEIATRNAGDAPSEPAAVSRSRTRKPAPKGPPPA
ncbi:MAG: hypothetical protein ACSLE5_10000 [Porticoccaceae bacterium]